MTIGVTPSTRIKRGHCARMCAQGVGPDGRSAAPGVAGAGIDGQLVIDLKRARVARNLFGLAALGVPATLPSSRAVRL